MLHSICSGAWTIRRRTWDGNRFWNCELERVVTLATAVCSTCKTKFSTRYKRMLNFRGHSKGMSTAVYTLSAKLS